MAQGNKSKKKRNRNRGERRARRGAAQDGPSAHAESQPAVDATGPQVIPDAAEPQPAVDALDGPKDSMSTKKDTSPERELRHWTGIQRTAADINLFRKLLGSARDGADGLTFKNYTTAGIDLPKLPRPAQHAFPSRDAHTISNIGGGAEEVDLADFSFMKLFETKFQAVFIPDPLSRWADTPEARTRHGTTPDGTFWRWYALIFLAGIGQYLPDVGQKARIFAEVPFQLRDLPEQTSLSFNQVCVISDGIFRGLSDAERRGQDAQTGLQRRLDKALQTTNPDEELVEDLTAMLETVEFNTRRKAAANYLFGCMPQPSANDLAMFQGDADVARYHAAVTTFSDLDRHTDEDDNVWLDRIRRCVRDRGLVQPVPTVTPLDTSFHAIRLPLPAGIAADVAIFSCTTPTQEFWDPGYDKPPCKFDIPISKLVGPLHQSIPRLFTGETSKNLVTIKIWADSRESSLKAECDAITTINQFGADTQEGQWREHIVDFRDFGPRFHRNLLQAFPALQEALDANRYDKHRAQAFLGMADTNAGRFFIDGCPGAGKATMVVEICWAVMEREVQPGWIPDDTPPPAQVARKSLKQNGDVDKTDSGTPDAAPAADADDGWKIPEGWDNWDDAPATAATAAGARTGRVAWTAPSNALVQDAADRLRRRCPHKSITRIYPFEVEMRNVFVERPERPALPDGMELLATAEQQMIRHHTYVRQELHDTVNPASDPSSLSEKAKTLARQQPETYALFLEGLWLKCRDPSAFAQRLSQFKKEARALLTAVADQSDAIVGMPVAFDQFARHITWQPDFIAVNEAARLTEAAALILTSRYPAAACAFIGGPRQLGPIVKTADQREFLHLFGKQRQVSLLERAFFNDAIDVTLSRNYCCHGSSGEWARDEFYSTKMSLVNRRSPHTKAFRDYLHTFGARQAETTTLWIDCKEAQDQLVGTSYINPNQARFVVELALQMLREAPLVNMRDVAAGAGTRVRRGEILILVAYANQKAVYKRRLAEISIAECPPNLISVRTIDDSLGHEADLVIIDFVRSGAPGFIDDPRRLAVAMTRARLANVIVASATIAPPRGRHITSLYRWVCDRHGDLRTTSKANSWTMWCEHCIQPGHEALACVHRVECTSCHETGRPDAHAGRHCSQPTEMSIWADVPIRPIDNIARHVMPGAQAQEKGKRMKVRDPRSSRPAPDKDKDHHTSMW